MPWPPEMRPLRVIAAAEDDGTGDPDATLEAFADAATAQSRWLFVSDSERTNLAQVVLIAQDLLRSSGIAGLEIDWAGGRPHTMHSDGTTWVSGTSFDGVLFEARVGATRHHVFFTYAQGT